MPIIREWKCGDCGTTGETMGALEDVVCHACSAQEAERVFLTAPSIKSPQTSTADKELKNLAADFGMSNMTNKDGAAVRQAPTGPQAPRFDTGSPQAMQMIQRLGANSDGFSSVLPNLQRSGRPHQWRKSPDRR